jgi:N-acetylneuraminate synthase
MKFGLKCRFGDFHEMLSFGPQVVEFHFSDKDLNVPHPEGTYEQELIVHAPEYLDNKLVDLGSLGETNQILSREQSINVIRRTIAKTLAMAKHFRGRPSIIIHPGGYSMNPIDAATKKQMVENLKKSVKELAHPHVDLHMENLPPFPWFFGGQYTCNIFLDAEEIRQFCEATGTKICFDTSHSKLYCNHANKDIIEEIRLLKPYIRHLHISDAAGVDGEGLQIEEGDIDWRTVIPLLQADVTFVPEIWKGHERHGHGFRVAMDRLSKYLG